MRLRCPNNNCPLDVSDDLVGVRIRCPHCGGLLFVDPKYAEPSPDQIQASKPTDKPTPKDPIDLERQIYDGLPPLALMMALKRRQGYDYDARDFGSNHEMTDDDWKALDAFALVVRAGYQLRTALIFCVVGIAINLIVVAGILALPGLPEGYAQLRAVSNFGSAPVLAIGLFVIYFGGLSFCNLRAGLLAQGLPWAMLMLTMVFGSIASINALTVFGEPNADLACFVLLSVPLNVLGALSAGIACWRVISAQDGVRPPEILHRLTEALKYLE